MTRFIRQPSRGFDIISNEVTPSSFSLPKIFHSKKSSIYETQKYGASFLNRSNYDYDIITARGLTQALKEPAHKVISNKKVYAISKFSQDTQNNSMRYREQYASYSCNKRFNRKKGLVNQFLGNEVNTITGWLKRQ